jgi:hypothetical protein
MSSFQCVTRCITGVSLPLLITTTLGWGGDSDLSVLFWLELDLFSAISFINLQLNNPSFHLVLFTVLLGPYFAFPKHLSLFNPHMRFFSFFVAGSQRHREVLSVSNLQVPQNLWIPSSEMIASCGVMKAKCQTGYKSGLILHPIYQCWDPDLDFAREKQGMI